MFYLNGSKILFRIIWQSYWVLIDLLILFFFFFPVFFGGKKKIKLFFQRDSNSSFRSGLSLFRHLTFWQETFQHRHFITGTFWHLHVSALPTYRRMEISSPWTFWHRDFSTPEHLGTWTFWHLAKKYGCFGTDISAPVLQRRNVQVPKFHRAEMFLCRTFLVMKTPGAKNIPVLKRPSTRMSAVPNGARAKMFLWWNVRAEMTLAETLGSKMVGSHLCIVNWPFCLFVSESSFYMNEPLN